MKNPNTSKDNQMKKIKILLSLITITILLASCGLITGVYSEKYGDDWATSNTQ